MRLISAIFLLFIIGSPLQAIPMNCKNLSASTLLSLRQIERTVSEVLPVSGSGNITLYFTGSSHTNPDTLEFRSRNQDGIFLQCNPRTDFIRQPRVFQNVLGYFLQSHLGLTYTPKSNNLPYWWSNGIRELALQQSGAGRFLKNNINYPLLSSLAEAGLFPDLNSFINTASSTDPESVKPLSDEISRLLVTVTAQYPDGIVNALQNAQKTDSAQQINQSAAAVLAKLPPADGADLPAFWQKTLWNKFNPMPVRLSRRQMNDCMVISNGQSTVKTTDLPDIVANEDFDKLKKNINQKLKKASAGADQESLKEINFLIGIINTLQGRPNERTLLANGFNRWNQSLLKRERMDRFLYTSWEESTPFIQQTRYRRNWLNQYNGTVHEKALKTDRFLDAVERRYIY